MVHQLSNLSIRVACAGLALVVTASAKSPGYALHKVMDTNGSGGLAMTYQIPQGWSGQDNILWNLNLRLNPMSYSLGVANADKSEWVSYLSGLTFAYSWSGGRIVSGRQPPVQPSDFLVQDVQATLQGRPFQVVDRQDTPIPFPGTSVPGVSKRGVHSDLAIRFAMGQGEVEQRLSMDFYGYCQSAGAGMLVGNWFVSGLTVVNAPVNQMPEAQQVCNAVLSSERMSKEFANRYQQVCKMLLEKTKAENLQAQRQRAQRVIHGGGGLPTRIMDKDTFLLHESIKGLRSHMFSWSIGN